MFAGGSENVTDPPDTLGVLGLGAGAGAGVGVGAGAGLGAFVFGAQYGAGEYDLDSDLLCPPLSAIALTAANIRPIARYLFMISL